MVRRILASLSLIALAFALTACATPAATEPPPATAGSVPPTAESVPATTPEPASALPPGPASTAPVPAGAPIVIGGAFDLSGAGQQLDEPAAEGAKLAAQEINAAGGVLGRPIELVVRDTTGEAEAIATAMRAMVEQDGAMAFVGFSDTSAVLAGGPVAQAAGLPFVTVGATSPKLPAQVGDMLFLACFGDNVQAAAGAEFAAARFGKTAYLLSDGEEAYTRLLAGYFEDRFTELGGTLVAKDTFDDQAPQLAAQIAALKALPEQPDFYYVAAMPYNAGAVVTQLRAAGLTAPIVGGDGYDAPQWVAEAGPAAADVFFTTHALMDGSGGTPRVQGFMTAYEQAYGQAPASAFAALGYDAVHLLADAIARAGSTDGAAIRAALEATTDYPAVTGSISYAAADHIPRKAVTVVAVRDGRFTLAEEVQPEHVPAP